MAMTLNHLIEAAQFFSKTPLVVCERTFKENLATWDIAVDKTTGALHKFDVESLQFHEISGLSDCVTLLTTKRPEKM